MLALCLGSCENAGLMVGGFNQAGSERLSYKKSLK